MSADLCGTRRPRVEYAMAALFCAIGLGLSLCYTYYSIFSKFQPYDDEGFALIALRYFCRGQALYDQVFSCYQPFYFLVYGFLFKIWGAPICHDNIRLLTIVFWMAAAGINGFLTFRLTASFLATLFAFVLSVLYFSPFDNEPGHPLALTYLLVAGTVALFTCNAHKAPVAFLLGILIGCLGLIKVNIGFYTAVAVGFVFAATTAGTISIRLRRIIGAIMVLVPACLIFSRIPEDFWSAPHILVAGILILALMSPAILRDKRRGWWVGMIAATAALSLILCPSANFYEFYLGILLVFSTFSVGLIVGSDCLEPVFRYRQWLWGMFGGGIAAAVILGATLLLGTSLHGLMEGLFIVPIRQASTFAIPRSFTGAAAPLIGLGGMTACHVYLQTHKAFADHRWFHYLLAIVKGLFALLAIISQVSVSNNWPPLPAAFAWLLLATGKDIHNGERVARLALVAVAVMQPLLAYPVSGSQCAPAGILLQVIAIVCFVDAIRAFKSLAHGLAGSTRLRAVAGCLVALTILLPIGKHALQAYRHYVSLTPLGLPGSSLMRLPQEDVSVYRSVVQQLAAPGVETFLTLPGLNSLYLWAEKDPPTGFNVTHWMSLLDERCQEQIWSAARNRSGLLVVKYDFITNIWMTMWPHAVPLARIPLARHIIDNFKTKVIIGPMEVMERR